MFIGKWLAPDPYDDNDVEMVRQWAESAVDAIPGDVHAHLAQQKGALAEIEIGTEGSSPGGYFFDWKTMREFDMHVTTFYRLVDPPQETQKEQENRPCTEHD
jgi:hypothetical protein